MIFQKHINGLRAFAVIAVVLYHFGIAGFSAGFVGVDIFFVISGFLMTNILLKADAQGKIEALRFFANRLRRIGPALAILCLVVAIGCGIYQLSNDYIRLLRNDLSSLFYFSNFSFRSEAGYFDAATNTKPLIHTWSLSVEWQFYLFLPLLIFLTRRVKNWRLAAFSVISLISLAFCIYTSQTKPDDAFYLLPSRTWEFLLGGMLCLFPSSGWLRRWFRESNLPSLAGLILLIVSMFVVRESNPFPGWQALLPTLGTALILYDNGNNRVNQILAVPVLQFFGNISYAWYLWHWPVYVWLSLGASKDGLSFNQKLIGIVASVVISYASYRWIEVPTRSNKTLWTNKRILLFYLAAISLVAIALLVAKKTNGMDFRLPSYVARAEFASSDHNPRRAECFLERVDSRAQSSSDYCRIGAVNKEKPEFFLWGDSYADAIQVAADEAATKLGMSGEVATISGCAPIDEFPFIDPALKIQFPGCTTDFNKRAYANILKTDSLKIVVLAANWLLYDEKILARRLPQIVCDITKTGKKVILVGAVPASEFDVPHTWALRQFESRRPIDVIAISESSQAPVVGEFKRISDAVTAACDGVTILQPMETLCNGKDCFLVNNGKSNYSDQWHLSTHGAKLLTEPLYQTIRKSLSQQDGGTTQTK